LALLAILPPLDGVPPERRVLLREGLGARPVATSSPGIRPSTARRLPSLPTWATGLPALAETAAAAREGLE